MENTLQMWTLQPPEQNKTESDKLTLKTRVKTLEQSSKALSTTTTTTVSCRYNAYYCSNNDYKPDYF